MSSIAVSAAAPLAHSLKNLLQGPLGRLLLLLALWLLLQIPLGLIENLVHERQQRRDQAGAEVTGKWGGAQRQIGPVLRVPYLARTGGSDGRIVETRRALYLLPEQLALSAELKTQERRRGIFSFPVYGAQLVLAGHFRRPDLGAWIGSSDEVLWQQAQLQIGLSDVRAIRAESQLQWNGRLHELLPAAGEDWSMSGIHALLQPAAGSDDLFDAAGNAAFELLLGFNGSGELYFAPVGRDTTAKLQADWAHPSFQGTWLPTASAVSPGMFTAAWSISDLGRGYPQAWTTGGEEMQALQNQLFGVALLAPVDAYRMAERVTKYAVLAVFFTFVTVWLTELLSGRRVHALQYLQLGAALCLFGLLQLAFGEHFGFGAGFAVATVAVTGMVTLYSRSVLQRWAAAAVVGGVLGGLYVYLYVLLQAEDYALLGGSVMLFAGLGAVMLLTRRIDWQQAGGAKAAD